MAEPVYQCFQMRVIFLTHRCELHCKSTTGLCTPHNSVGPDLSLPNKKIQLDCRTHNP